MVRGSGFGQTIHLIKEILKITPLKVKARINEKMVIHMLVIGLII